MRASLLMMSITASDDSSIPTATITLVIGWMEREVGTANLWTSKVRFTKANGSTGNTWVPETYLIIINSTDTGFWGFGVQFIRH